MNNNFKDKSIIERILNYCNDIIKMVDRFGKSIEAFEADFAYIHACSMCIIQIGELSALLSDGFKDEYNKIPWKGIKSMRNLFAHNYEGISILKTWNTIEIDIPELFEYCQEIIEQIEKGDKD